MATEAELRAVKLRHSARLLQISGVCGIGIEQDDAGEYVLVVHVNAREAGAGEKVPKTLEGHRLKVVRSGPFKSQAKK